MEYQQSSKTKNYLSGLVLTCGGFYLGYYIGILNPIGEEMLKKVYNYEGSEEKDKQRESMNGALNMVFSLGAFLGVSITGYLSDRIGRKTVMMFSDILAIVISGFFLIRIIEVLMLARFFCGLVGAVYIQIGAVIVSELYPNKIAGFANAFGYVFLTLAILVSYTIPYLFEKEFMIENSRYFLFFPVVISIFKLIMTPVFVRSDTPKYIYSSESNKESAKEKIITAYSFIYASESIQKAASDTIESFEKQEGQSGESMAALFGPRYRLRLISGMFLCFAQQMSGINFLVFYSTKLFEDMGKDRIMTLVIGLANFGGSFIALYAVGRFGRKFNIVLGCLFQGLGMLLLFIGFQTQNFEILALAVVVYILFFAIGLGGSQMAYISEILPPIGVGLACAIQWIFTALIGQYLLTFMRICGPTVLILFFMTSCLMFFVGLDYMMIETKDKTEETIGKEFETKHYRILDFR